MLDLCTEYNNRAKFAHDGSRTIDRQTRDHVPRIVGRVQLRMNTKWLSKFPRSFSPYGLLGTYSLRSSCGAHIMVVGCWENITQGREVGTIVGFISVD